MSDEPMKVQAKFKYGTIGWDIPVKDPDGRIVGKVTGGTYNAVDGTTLDLEIDDPAMIQAMQKGAISSFSIGEDALRLVQDPPVPSPQIVHLVKSVKQHVAVCSGEPYSGSTGRGPVKLCPECYNKTFKEHDHKAVQHRDGKEPWCRVCELTQDGREPKSIFRKGES